MCEAWTQRCNSNIFYPLLFYYCTKFLSYFFSFLLLNSFANLNSENMQIFWTQTDLSWFKSLNLEILNLLIIFNYFTYACYLIFTIGHKLFYLKSTWIKKNIIKYFSKFYNIFLKKCLVKLIKNTYYVQIQFIFAK